MGTFNCDPPGNGDNVHCTVVFICKAALKIPERGACISDGYTGFAGVRGIGRIGCRFASCISCQDRAVGLAGHRDWG